MIYISLLERFTHMGHSAITLTKQHRTIPVIRTLISEILFPAPVTSVVNLAEHSNVDRLTHVLTTVYTVPGSMAFLDVPSENSKVNPSRSQLSSISLDLSLQFETDLIHIGIEFRDIKILFGCRGHVGCLDIHFTFSPTLTTDSIAGNSEKCSGLLRTLILKGRNEFEKEIIKAAIERLAKCSIYFTTCSNANSKWPRNSLAPTPYYGDESAQGDEVITRAPHMMFSNTIETCLYIIIYFGLSAALYSSADFEFYYREMKSN